jgi:hypothetical protein
MSEISSRMRNCSTIVFKEGARGWMSSGSGMAISFPLEGEYWVVVAAGDSWPFEINPPSPHWYKDWVGIRTPNGGGLICYAHTSDIVAVR